jgi:hypothetical protein
VTTDPVLTLGWLVLAHLVADFVLQTTAIVQAKRARDGRAWRGLLGHGAGVAVCLVPFALAFGVPGLWALVAITVSHVAIDRAKVVATGRAEARALAEARGRHEGRAPAEGLGRAWTPLPAAWFAIDQLAHLAVLGAVWATWLAGQSLTVEWTAAVAGVTVGRDPAAVHHIALVAVVLASLLISNVRGGAIFVATLVRPLEQEEGELGDAAMVDVPRATVVPPAMVNRNWSFQLGPLRGSINAEPAGPQPAATIAAPDQRPGLPSPARVGAAIGILERILIVTFVLAGAEAAIGFVIAAKTIARFRQLDDRDFAEYYLLGTLGSVSVAILTALVARAALTV